MQDIVCDVAVDEDVAGLAGADCGFGDAGVGAADPEEVGGLAGCEGGEEVGGFGFFEGAVAVEDTVDCVWVFWSVLCGWGWEDIGRDWDGIFEWEGMIYDLSMRAELEICSAFVLAVETYSGFHMKGKNRNARVVVSCLSALRDFGSRNGSAIKTWFLGYTHHCATKCAIWKEERKR